MVDVAHEQGGENLVGFNKAVRAAAGVEAVDTIDVVIVADATPREAVVLIAQGKPRR